MGLEDLLIEQLANNDTQVCVSNSFIQWGCVPNHPRVITELLRDSHSNNRTPERLPGLDSPLCRCHSTVLTLGKMVIVFQPICTFLPSSGDGQSHQKHPLIRHPMESPRLCHCDWMFELDHCGLNTSWENKTFHRRLTRYMWMSFSVVLSLFFVRSSRGVSLSEVCLTKSA